jgi:hypothetical protein
MCYAQAQCTLVPSIQRSSSSNSTVKAAVTVLVAVTAYAELKRRSVNETVLCADSDQYNVMVTSFLAYLGAQGSETLVHQDHHCQYITLPVHTTPSRVAQQLQLPQQQ